jgi:hypothetical protein
MAATDKDLETLLRFDSLSRAEEITGKDSHSDENTMWTGLILMQANAKAKEAVLTAQNDSVFMNRLDRYFDVIAAEGFYKIFEMDIAETPGKFFVFWHDDGILLKFDTYNATHVNSGKFYYNWKPNSDFDRNVLSSHAGYNRGEVIIGDHDCREAIRFHIRRLREEGRFVSPWEKRPSVFWMLHYKDYKDVLYKWGEKPSPYDLITAERVAMFPEHVRKAITPEVPA